MKVTKWHICMYIAQLVEDSLSHVNHYSSMVEDLESARAKASDCRWLSALAHRGSPKLEIPQYGIVLKKETQKT